MGSLAAISPHFQQCRKARYIVAVGAAVQRWQLVADESYSW